MTSVKWPDANATGTSGIRTPEKQNPRGQGSRGLKRGTLGAGYSRATPNSCISQMNMVTKLP